jgi:hypothetical protein
MRYTKIMIELWRKLMKAIDDAVKALRLKNFIRHSRPLYLNNYKGKIPITTLYRRPRDGL